MELTEGEVENLKTASYEDGHRDGRGMAATAHEKERDRLLAIIEKLAVALGGHNR